MPAQRIDPANSTNLPLLAGQSFAGEFTNVLDFMAVSLMVHSDVASANDGLRLEWSTDGQNVDDFQTFDYAGTASAGGLSIHSTVRTAFVRVSYENNSLVDQTFMRLQTLLRRSVAQGSIGYIGQSVTSNEDSLLTKSVLAARDISSGTDVVLPFCSADPFLIVEHPPNRSTLVQRNVAQADASQQLDFFGLFGTTRRAMSVYNDSNDDLMIRLGSAATLTDWDVKLKGQGFWELPQSWGLYSGTVHGIWDKVGTGAAHVLEIF